MDIIFMFLKKMSSGGCVPPALPRGYIHVHVYDHNIQISSSLILLG